jgi:hypothetical protein
MNIGIEIIKKAFSNMQEGHIVAYYETDDLLLESLCAYLNSSSEQQSCIVITKPLIISRLHKTLSSNNSSKTHSNEQFTAMDSLSVLDDFMIEGKPSKKLFFSLMNTVIENTPNNNKPLRIYGDMVVKLWESGDKEAALDLEQLWTELGKIHTFSLYCAYPLKILELKAKEIEQIDKSHGLSVSLITA